MRKDCVYAVVAFRSLSFVFFILSEAQFRNENYIDL